MLGTILKAPANFRRQNHKSMKKSILKISFSVILIILILASIVLFTKNGHAHIQIERKPGEIVFSENVTVAQSPYFLNFTSSNIKEFLEKSDIKDADQLIIYHDGRIIYRGSKGYLRSLDGSQQWGLPGRVIKDGNILADMFAISHYYNGHIFKEPYSKQYFLEMSCVDEHDPFPMYGETRN